MALMSLTTDTVEVKPALAGSELTWRTTRKLSRHWLWAPLLFPLLIFPFPNAGAQSFGGATTFISHDFYPARSAMAVDSFGRIYVVFDVIMSRTPTPTGVLTLREIRLGRSTDGGSTFSVKAVAAGQIALPSVAVSADGNVHIAYLSGVPCSSAGDCHERPASERPAIVVTSSTDGGESFLPAIQVSTPAVTTVDWESNVAVDGAGKVYVVWSESDTTDPEAEGNFSPNIIKLRTSSDHGQSFSPPVVIQADPGTRSNDQFIPGNLTNPNLAVTSGGQIHVTWSECKTNACAEYYYRRSLDGASFSAPLLIDQYIASATFGAQDIAVDNSGRVSVVYTRDDSGNDYRINVYHTIIENGAIQGASNVSNVPSEFEAYEPAVAIDGLGRIFVAWSGSPPGASSRSEPHDIMLRRSSDRGRTFSAAANVSNTPESSSGSGHSYFPGLAIGLAGTPLIVWGDNATISNFTSTGELRFRRAPDPVEVLDPRGSFDADENGALLGDVNDAVFARDFYEGNRRGGVVADGVSKLLIMLRSTSSLTFTLKSSDGLSRGTLAALGQADTGATFAVVPAGTASNGDSVVVAVYTPPDSFGQTTGTQRSATIEIRPTDSPDTGSVSISLAIERPPIVVVPNVWEPPETLDFLFALRDQGFRAGYLDYDTSQTFDPATFNLGDQSSGRGTDYLLSRIQSLVEEYSSRSIAASQVDVVAHGMGGLIARSLIQQDRPDYRNKSGNLNKGYIHRLITIGTPHFGSPLAKILFDNRNLQISLSDDQSTTLADYFSKLGQPLDRGAVEALSPGSVAFSNLSATAIKSYSIGASWSGSLGGSPSASYAGLQAFLQITLRNPALANLDQVFGSSTYDLFASQESQHAGPNGPTFDSIIHSNLPPVGALADISELESEDIRLRAVEALSTDSLTFKDGFPDPPMAGAAPALLSRSSAPSQATVSKRNASAAETKGITITEPAEGATFEHYLGGAIRITAEPVGATSPEKITFLVQGIGMFVVPDAAPYTVDVPLPHNAPLGTINILALASDLSGDLLGDSKTVSLTQTSIPAEIRVEPGEVVLTPGGPSQQLLVAGRFFWPASEPGVTPQGWAWKDVTRAAQGTTYAARRGQEIVSVNENGELTPVKEGFDRVEVRHRGHIAVVPVTVAPPFAVPPPALRTVLGNISTRLRVETGDNVLIGGFIVTGTQPKKIIVRGIGTSLPFADKLENPTLELHGPSGLIQANDNWVDSPNKQAIIDSTIPPANDLESAIVATLPANNAQYTAIIRGSESGTGIGVVEAYDLDSTVDSKLANISTRGFVQTGDNVLIAGTIIVGQTPQKVLVRAIGPSLPFPGVLGDPTLELRDQNGGLVAGNDNWRSTQEAEIIDTTIPPTNDFESAIVATLPANAASYTAIVRGVNDAAGIAVVEIYALN